jgi:hypothetical protein
VCKRLYAYVTMYPHMQLNRGSQSRLKLYQNTYS